MKCKYLLITGGSICDVLYHSLNIYFLKLLKYEGGVWGLLFGNEFLIRRYANVLFFSFIGILVPSIDYLVISFGLLLLRLVSRSTVYNKYM